MAIKQLWVTRSPFDSEHQAICSQVLLLEQQGRFIEHTSRYSHKLLVHPNRRTLRWFMLTFYALWHKQHAHLDRHTELVLVSPLSRLNQMKSVVWLKSKPSEYSSAMMIHFFLLIKL